MARDSAETRLPQAGPVLLLPKMTTFLWAYSTSLSPTPWPPSHVDFALALRDGNTSFESCPSGRSPDLRQLHSRRRVAGVCLQRESQGLFPHSNVAEIGSSTSCLMRASGTSRLAQQNIAAECVAQNEQKYAGDVSPSHLPMLSTRCMARELTVGKRKMNGTKRSGTHRVPSHLRR